MLTASELFYNNYNKGEVREKRKHNSKELESFICAFCGQQRTGLFYRTKDIFSACFGEWSLTIKYNSSDVCTYCENIFQKKFQEQVFIGCWKNNLKFTPIKEKLEDKTVLGEKNIIKKEDILNLLLNPPEPPFFFSFTSTSKGGKHFLNFAIVNYSRDIYYVNFGSSILTLDINKFNNIMNMKEKDRKYEDNLAYGWLKYIGIIPKYKKESRKKKVDI